MPTPARSKPATHPTAIAFGSETPPLLCSYPTPIGLFPTTTDNRQVRTIAYLRFAVACLITGLTAAYDLHEKGYDVGKWMTIGLLADFALVTLFGAGASAHGAITVVRLRPIRHHW